MAVGVANSGRAAFEAAEGGCRAAYPFCACAATYSLEDGTGVPWDHAVVACVEGECSAGGTLGDGGVCGAAPISDACGADLKCCYRCGIPGCDLTCAPPCGPDSDTCSGGCPTSIP